MKSFFILFSAILLVVFSICAGMFLSSVLESYEHDVSLYDALFIESWHEKDIEVEEESEEVKEIDFDNPLSDRMIQRRDGSFQMSCMFGNLMMNAVNKKEENPVLITDIDYIADTNTRVYILEYNEIKYLVVENTSFNMGGISVTKMD
jgi:hypothetical protein